MRDAPARPLHGTPAVGSAHVASYSTPTTRTLAHAAAPSRSAVRALANGGWRVDGAPIARQPPSAARRVGMEAEQSPAFAHVAPAARRLLLRGSVPFGRPSMRDSPPAPTAARAWPTPQPMLPHIRAASVCTPDGLHIETPKMAELERSRHVAFSSPLHESFFYTREREEGGSAHDAVCGEGERAFATAAPARAAKVAGKRTTPVRSERDPAREQALGALLREIARTDSPREPVLGVRVDASEPRMHEQRKGAASKGSKARPRAPVDFQKSLNFAEIDVRSARKLGARAVWK
ncbi:hypothetical protein KFE25_010665 [Diacronema lutheri]|uniref:Uncharacterized protein n=1 Tax=Diacronema lutheri TaxID=2081491 RepID=A0A8J6C5B1_DIALT|nr:hypothetical protein KFE25_010665 [Diacronema lutheri]